MARGSRALGLAARSGACMGWFQDCGVAREGGFFRLIWRPPMEGESWCAARQPIEGFVYNRRVCIALPVVCP